LRMTHLSPCVYTTGTITANCSDLHSQWKVQTGARHCQSLQVGADLSSAKVGRGDMSGSCEHYGVTTAEGLSPTLWVQTRNLRPFGLGVTLPRSKVRLDYLIS
jgi:hypothetical protein